MAAHYNNLRRDALLLGQPDLDAVSLGTFLKRFASGIQLIYLSSNRIRLLYNPLDPPTLVINGCLLQNNAVVDLPAGQFSGSAATWYIFAVRTPGASTFTLQVNTSALETADTRIIGVAIWSGTKVDFVYSTLSPSDQLLAADYDSGWFAVAATGNYTKAHGLLQWPRLVVLLHSVDAGGTQEWIPVSVIQNSAATMMSAFGWSSVNVYADAGEDGASAATCYSSRRSSSSGYWRILAWR